MKNIDLSHKVIESFNDTLIKELPRNLKELYLYDNKINSFEHSEGLPRLLKKHYLW